MLFLFIFQSLELLLPSLLLYQVNLVQLLIKAMRILIPLSVKFQQPTVQILILKAIKFQLLFKFNLSKITFQSHTLKKVPQHSFFILIFLSLKFQSASFNFYKELSLKSSHLIINPNQSLVSTIIILDPLSFLLP